jgi:RNA polymerase sigma-32 factor
MPKKLFFSLRKAKIKISAFEDGDQHPDEVRLIASHVSSSLHSGS